MPDAGLDQLLASIKELEHELGNTYSELGEVNARLDSLPEYYIPRREADVKAGRIKAALGVLLLCGVIVAGGLVTIWANNRQVCREDRTFNRDLITIAVADRQPLSTSTPEMVAAIEDQNARLVRPLRERLLSLDGAHPEKC